MPSNPAAAPALQPWAADLVTGDLEVLTRKCWTVPPLEIPTMYGDKDSVLAALAEPGVDGQYAVTWTGAGVTVAVKRSEIASGYACPRVYATGSNGDFTPADARHVVRRYLSRLVGTPLSPDDVEGAYPLVCSAAQTWDPEGTGNPIAPPFATNSNLLTGTKAFAGDDIESTPLQLDYLSVTVPITNAAGVTATKDFTLRIGSEGYCIGDMSA
ncbi:hypothetical protein [Antrihabitans sp. YC2-6]|uniref:hypothetical protein n=1 Tax=Antrihabitans sp. YC2-6 TaxID=2799498 RepID=UPI001F31DE48|nr:hypothetical protein [Antrihabitans sp. YC2-6]